jgi:hypothetical protein
MRKQDKKTGSNSVPVFSGRLFILSMQRINFPVVPGTQRAGNI